MGFFQKLKDRLFKLDYEPETKDQASAKGDTNKAIAKAEKKVAKREAKTLKEVKKSQQRTNRYVTGLQKSNDSFNQSIKALQARHVKLDDAFFEELEEVLILSDISHLLVTELIQEIQSTVKQNQVHDLAAIGEIIADKLYLAYANQDLINLNLNIKPGRLNVILVTGVNGSGKTTSIAKLANWLKNDNYKVLIAAGDTFRAGAVNQLAIWAERINVAIVKPFKDGADPASVVYDGLAKAKADGYDVLIIDTAGRLQNKVNLMQELAKINKLIAQEVPDAPHESLLVIDATTGQNGLQQGKAFKEVTPISGIILTKMDGTSRGGIILSIKSELEIPVKLVGLGEGLDDLQEFDLDAFIYGLTKDLQYGN